jgi:hypothetical protein
MGNLFDNFIRMRYEKIDASASEKQAGQAGINRHIPSDAAQALTRNHFPPRV